MFEVGKKYEFTFLSRSEEGLYESPEVWRVTAMDGHLLHLHTPAISDGKFLLAGGPIPAQDMILNTSSAFFHSARPYLDPA